MSQRVLGELGHEGCVIHALFNSTSAVSSHAATSKSLEINVPSFLDLLLKI